MTDISVNTNFLKRKLWAVPCKICVSDLRHLVDQKLESGVSLKAVRKWLFEQGFTVGLTTVFRHSRHYVQARRTIQRIKAQRRSSPQVIRELCFNLNILDELINRYLYSATTSSSYCVTLHKILAERRLTLMALAELTEQVSMTKISPQTKESTVRGNSLWSQVNAESEKLKREPNDACKEP